MGEIDWTEIARQLQAPFDPADVEFRPQGKLLDGHGRAIAYVDARVVAARLDAVVGPLNWAFDWEPVILDNAVRVVKGTITIHGVSKSDIGDGDKTEPSKAAVSDALKRTAVLWGPGRYLYHLEAERVQGRAGQGDNWFIPDSEIKRLRDKLPRPDAQEGAPAAVPVPDETALRAAWADFRYAAGLAGYSTAETQRDYLRGVYPDRRMNSLTAGEMWAQSTALRAGLGMAPHPQSGAESDDAA